MMSWSTILVSASAEEFKHFVFAYSANGNSMLNSCSPPFFVSLQVTTT